MVLLSRELRSPGGSHNRPRPSSPSSCSPAVRRIEPAQRFLRAPFEQRVEVLHAARERAGRAAATGLPSTERIGVTSQRSRTSGSRRRGTDTRAACRVRSPRCVCARESVISEWRVMPLRIAALAGSCATGVEDEEQVLAAPSLSRPVEAAQSLAETEPARFARNELPER